MKTEDRQEEILDTALEIIHEDGYKDLTVRNIADRIGISEPAIYRHFDKKEEIVRGLAERVFRKDCSRPDLESCENLHDLLRDILRDQFEMLEENPHVTSVLFQSQIFREYPEVEELFIDHRKEKEDYLKEIVKRGQEKGFFSKDVDEEVFALLFMGAVRMSVLKWKDEEFSYSLIRKTDQIVGELFRMLNEAD
ncbi:hypothetical protein AKJ62_02485 [candidate division MSBL1 archaeon SCGC-AAA259D14]|uniref:HTH tetR-type domain-containing protein n=2 Tax=candidate division MSBL1 TaxID=215777 RepID=A0A133U699_9EURY|nr:hypothetical protein AKJ62_02485 [candidate division MSBL1 archaeon SCGC-AAA259D14]KXA93803.1 hypothetical protein AKJ66_00830 [candidate division MSBL1 archaeon SCGC-AAA259E22]